MSKQKSKGRRPYPNITNTASSTGTTGTMPTPPADSSELESYRQLGGTQTPSQRSRK